MVSTSTSVPLAAQTRKRIEQLETRVQELTGALGVVYHELLQRGVMGATAAADLVVQRLLEQGKQVRPQRGAGTGRTRVAPASASHGGEDGLAGAVRRGEAARLAWIAEREVVPAKELAAVWGLTPQALGPAEKRGELFAVVIKRQRYYAREFLELDRDDVASVCKLLGPLTASEKLLFWKRPHGALRGKTVAQALTLRTDGTQLARVAQLAGSWASQADAAAGA